jgi:hypothetical protein
MADDLTTQNTTLATPPTATKFKLNETTTRGLKQVVQVNGFARASANFNRPADTAAYASGDLVGNSTTAASVAALSWTAAEAYTTQSEAGFAIRKAKLKKSTTSVTGAAFRLHLYGTDPAATSGILNGDNGAFSVNDASYLGWFDFPSMIGHRNFAVAVAGPAAGVEIAHALSSGQTIYGLLQAQGAYTPGNAETFTVELEIWRL